MSIEFWKYVNDRYRYLNMRLVIPLWICLGLKFFTGFYEWLWAQGIWYGLAFDAVHHFFNLAILVGLPLGIIGMIKVTRWRRREAIEQHEREMERIRVMSQRGMRGMR